MQTWVVIEDINGGAIGEGPILTASAVQTVARVDRAGEWSFTMPADDPRTADIEAFRYARIWHADDNAFPGGARLVGGGRILRKRLTAAPGQAPMLEISGMSMLGDLGAVICHNLELWTLEQVHPTVVYHTVEGLLIHCNDLQIDDTATGDAVTLGSAFYTTVRYTAQFEIVQLLLSTGNLYPDTTWVNYWNGAAWVAPAGFSDGTLGLAQSGSIAFTMPTDWAKSGDAISYELRIGTYPDSSDVTITDVSVWTRTTSGQALQQLLSYAPDGWSLDTINGYSEIAPEELPTAPPELLTNTSFEDFSGTPDDAGADEFPGWGNVWLGGAGYAMSDAEYGTALKLWTDSVGTIFPFVTQPVEVAAETRYTLSFWTHGDGTGQAAVTVLDLTHGAWNSYVRITGAVDCGVTGTDWEQVKLTFMTPAGCTTIGIKFLGPIVRDTTAWITGCSLQWGGGIPPIYFQSADDSLLSMLIRMQEFSGEHFIEGFGGGRQIVWLGRDERPTGIRAIGAGVVTGAPSGYSIVELSIDGDDVDGDSIDGDSLDGLSIDGDSVDGLVISAVSTDAVCQIVAIEELQDVGDLASRIYPYGGGMGEERVSLREVNVPAPTGYTIDVVNGWLQYDAAVSVMGVIEAAPPPWLDIVMNTAGTPQRAAVSNALLTQAAAWLEEHSVTDLTAATGDMPRFYNITLAGCQRLLPPGYTIRVQNHSYNGSTHTVDIDRDLFITEARYGFTPQGAMTLQIQAGTRRTHRITDAQIMALAASRTRAIIAHNTAVGY